MAQVRSRENTFKIDLSSFPKRPSFEDLHKFVHLQLGLQLEQIKRLQMSHAQNCAFVKCSDLKIAQDIVATHNEKHEIEVNNTKIKIRLVMEDGGVEVKVHDLSENISNDEVIAFLRQYGEVISIKELTWGNGFAFQGISTGVRVVKMILRRHIKSFVVIHGEQTLITYRNQPQTCRHCTNLAHIGMSCVENKRLMGQKNDLNARLNAAKNGTDSYAEALKKRTTDKPIMPVLTNLNNVNRDAKASTQTQPADGGTESKMGDPVRSLEQVPMVLTTRESTLDHSCVPTTSALDNTSTRAISTNTKRSEGERSHTNWAEEETNDESTNNAKETPKEGDVEKRSRSPCVSTFKQPFSVGHAASDISMEVSETEVNINSDFSDLSDGASYTTIGRTKRETRKLKKLKT